VIQSVRFSKKESEQIRKKCTEINKGLVMSGKAPLKDSEFVHKILDISIAYVKLDSKGEVYIDL